MSTAEHAFLDFPRSAVVEHPDGGVTAVIARDRLIELESFVAALRMGLVESSGLSDFGGAG